MASASLLVVVLALLPMALHSRDPGEAQRLAAPTSADLPPPALVDVESIAWREIAGEEAPVEVPEDDASDLLAWAEGMVTVRVVDETGALPPDVEVIVVRGAKQNEFVLPETGVLEFPGADIAGATLCAMAHGRSIDTTQVGARPRAEYVLSLGEEAVLSGVLRMLDGEPVPEGARVFAWRFRETTSLERGLAVYASLPKGYSAEVERDGTFAIDGLKAGNGYGVTAYGGGVFVTYEHAAQRLVAPAHDIELAAGYVGAVDIDLDGPKVVRDLLLGTASPLPDLPGRYSEDSEHSTHVWWEWDIAATAVNARNWSTSLAGLARSDDPRRSLPLRTFVYGASRESVQVEGTARCVLPVLGALSARIATEPVVTAGDVPCVRIPLEGVPAAWTTQPFGSLRILFDPGAAPARSDERPLSARVRLLPPSGQVRDGLTLVATPDGSAGAYSVPLVPEGSYRFWCFDDMAGASVPERLREGKPIEVRSGETTLVDLTDVPMAAIELTVLRSDGRPFTGSLSGDLLVPYGGKGSYLALNKGPLHFDGPPYRLSMLPIARLVDGRCHVTVQSVYLGREYHFTCPLLALEPGRTTTLTVHMVDPVEAIAGVR